MKQPRRLALIGNALPRRCGIATFTTHLHQAISEASPETDIAIVAMTDHRQVYAYPPAVALEINDEALDDYVRAARFLNTGGFGVVSLQHEFGIFGGEAGSHILALLARLTVPVVTTLHTVLADPTPAQRRVLSGIIDASSTVVVMARKAHHLLLDVYRVPPGKIEVIPHGIPDIAYIDPELAKAGTTFAGRPMILTFGLLSPNKGIEVMIDAMPGILARRADAVYVVLGATHPNLVRQHGESYRRDLSRRVRELGIEDRVVFLDQFVDQATLLAFISMCDIYVTPYLSESQMTSGTLAYSFGLGRAVVSTPYWHAHELLADGRGVLVPFGDAAAIGKEIGDLLTDETRRRAMGERAYASSRSMTWARTAERYQAVLGRARRDHRLKVAAARAAPALPEMELGYLLSMCDDTGLLQHAIHSVPDRAHGYCIDDNARALLLACALNRPGERQLPEALAARFAAFVQHAWNPDTRRFRNFMRYDRTWIEESGSEDSHGRALWALGECARNDANPSRRRWAAALFAEALPTAEELTSPRAWAFTLLGLEAYCAAVPGAIAARSVRRHLAERLMAIMAAVASEEWVWFEEGLAYDNARLAQALIVTGMAAREPGYVVAGLGALRWLMTRQTTAAGLFRPVGTDSFGDGRRQPPRPFDQQPLEATATIAACLAAWRADGDTAWKAAAGRVFAWFLGSNDLSLPLVDHDTGSCRDGLHGDRPNENRGGESVVSYLLGLAEIRELARADSEPATLGQPRAMHA